MGAALTSVRRAWPTSVSGVGSHIVRSIARKSQVGNPRRRTQHAARTRKWKRQGRSRTLPEATVSTGGTRPSGLLTQRFFKVLRLVPVRGRQNINMESCKGDKTLCWCPSTHKDSVKRWQRLTGLLLDEALALEGRERKKTGLASHASFCTEVAWMEDSGDGDEALSGPDQPCCSDADVRLVQSKLASMLRWLEVPLIAHDLRRNGVNSKIKVQERLVLPRLKNAIEDAFKQLPTKQSEQRFLAGQADGKLFFLECALDRVCGA
ncbi:unnamed protein product, partial [Symbiodinium sp. CCMP2456]